ncbi:MAG: hypothetical protein ABIJ97_14010 [Bacteroidota bacterium]
MTNILMHIGLSVTEKDFEVFYKGVLDGKVINTFELSNEEAHLIFDIKKDVKILLMSCDNIVFELFIENEPRTPTFAHVCFQSEQAKEIVEKAKQKGYRTYTRNNKTTETYFICDANFNLFEIKTKVN